MQTNIFHHLAYQLIRLSSIAKKKMEMCETLTVLLTSLHKSWIHLNKLTGQTVKQPHSHGF